MRKLFRPRNLILLGLVVGVAVVVAKKLGGGSAEVDYSATTSYTPTYTPPAETTGPNGDGGVTEAAETIVEESITDTTD
ncbi:MAG: hypothetical protein IPM45_05235 [Acidimicrobiales bacterium]|nr:hypothetical protein [Acidimicrobiales bacterium]